MTKHRSISPIFMAAYCLLLSMVTGCGSVNLFNNDFLNTFMPLGQTSLNTIEGKGPVTIVLENLSIEAEHGENAVVTIHYVDAEGNTQQFTPAALSAVPADQRDPEGVDYDSSYKETIILDSGVREIWVTGTVYRTSIEITTETNQVDENTTVDYTYCTASPNTTQSLTAYQLPSVHLQESKHFKCGDVIVVGLLDVRKRNGSVILQTYECEYTNWGSLSQETRDKSGATPFSLSPSNIQLISDPVNQWIQEEYTYPTGYVLIPVVLPNLTGIADILPTMIQIASEYATE